MTRNKFFSLLLAAALAFQVLPISVFAQNDATTTVIVDAAAQDQNVDVGNISVENGDGIDITAENGNTAEVTTGDVQASDTGVSAQSSGDGSSVEANVGNVNAGSGGGDNSGIDASSSDGGTTVVQAESVQSEGTGVSASSIGEGSSTTVEVSGEVNSSYGINAQSSNGGKTEVRVEAAESEYGYGIYATSNEGSSTVVEVSGDVSGVVNAFSSEGSSIIVDVSGEVSGVVGTVSSGGSTTEVKIGSGNTDSVKEVYAQSDGKGSSIAVEVPSGINGGSTLTGIFAESLNGGKIDIKSGPVETGGTPVVSLNSSGEKSSITAEVTGNIISKGEPTVITNTSSDGSNYENMRHTNAIGISSRDNGEINLLTKDVYAEDQGLVVYASGEMSVKVETGNITSNGNTVLTNDTKADGSSSSSVNRSRSVLITNQGLTYYIDGDSVRDDAGDIHLTVGDIVSNDDGFYVYNTNNGTINIAARDITSNGEAIVTTNFRVEGSSY